MFVRGSRHWSEWWSLPDNRLKKRRTEGSLTSSQRYSYIRQFAPQFLATVDFHSNRTNDPLLAALEILKMLNDTGRRGIPETAPLSFVPSSWSSYVVDSEDRVSRRYYELSALWELRGALRAGNVWVKNSRRYANPESYLIPLDLWEGLRPEAIRLLGLPQTGEERFNQRSHSKEIISIR